METAGLRYSLHSVQNNKNVEETKVRTDLIAFLFCFQKAALGSRQTLEYFAFIARLEVKRSFPSPLCPHKCTAVPSVNTPTRMAPLLPLVNLNQCIIIPQGPC